MTPSFPVRLTIRFAVLTLLALPACQKQMAPAPAPPTVTVNRPVQHKVTDWDEYSGHIQSPQMAQVAARISGFIEEAPFKEGALVNKGDVLFVIDDRPFTADLEVKKAAVAKDEAQVVLTKTQLARNEDLLKKHTIADQDYDTSKANYAQAVAQLEADKAAQQTSALNLEWTRVTAPISGRVSRIMVTVGNLVNGGAGQATLLTSVVSIDPMYCYVPVPERLLLKYKTASRRDRHEALADAKIPCAIKLESETGYPHQGYVDFVDNSLDPRTGTIQLRGVFPNPDGFLAPGLSARMRITGSGAYNALLVPDVAVGTTQNERFLLVVNKDSVVETRPVILGALFGHLRAISSGLAKDERVVVDGLQFARAGSKVKAEDAQIPSSWVKAVDAETSDLSESAASPAAVSAAR